MLYLGPTPLVGLPRDMAGSLPGEFSCVVPLVVKPDSEYAFDWNDHLQRSNVPFVLLLPGVQQTLIGPLVLPYRSPCLRCMATQRLISETLDSTFAINIDFVKQSFAHLQVFLGRTSLLSLVGKQVLLDTDAQPCAETALMRVSTCSGCHEPPPPAEIHYVTQLIPTS